MKGQDMDQVTLVDYREALSIKVGEWLLEKRDELAICADRTYYSLTASNSLSVFEQNPTAQPRKYLFGLITLQPRRNFLGTLWFDNDVRQADKENWVFEIYGREHVDQMHNLANEMAQIFKVKIAIHIVREPADFEDYLYDH